ncbi:MAG: helix-turn-helix domain-containing protein [Pirellulaceae bacterium]
MLKAIDVLQIQRMAAEGCSQRVISRRLGFARETIRRVLDGRHAATRPRGAGDEGGPPPQGPIGRCPRCHATVELPCRACELREKVETRGRLPPASCRQAVDPPPAVQIAVAARKRVLRCA